MYNKCQKCHYFIEGDNKEFQQGLTKINSKFALEN